MGYENLRIAAMNRHRIRLFGDASPLVVYTSSPTTGESTAATFIQDWKAKRIEATTNNVAVEAGAWQFEVAAEFDWESSQAFMLKITALTVGTRRWAVKKIERPIGVSLVWKIKAIIQ